MRILFLFLFMLPLGWSKTVGGVAIIVKDEPITLYDIVKKINDERLSRDTAVDMLIREKLEAIEINKRSLTVTSEEIFDRIQAMAEQNRLSVSQLYEAVFSSERLTRDAFRDKVKRGLLAQKLYREIAFSQVQEPSEDDLYDYYRLHAHKYSYSETFEVTVYASYSRSSLAAKIANPMRYLPEVRMQNLTMRHNQINPRLAMMLQEHDSGTYLPIVPDPKQGYTSIYLRSKSMPIMQPFSSIKAQVKEAMIADEREQMLKDYFDRARMNANIKILRLP